jgi:hypothetical protein
MKTQKKWLASLGLCAALGATAATVVVDEVVAPPEPRQYNNVQVINGGASFEEVAAIKRIAPQYKLRVEISGRGGDWYVADRLRVVKGDEVVAEIPDAGPWLLMDVPPGRYTLEGEFEGHLVKRSVTVTANGANVHMVAPPSVD